MFINLMRGVYLTDEEFRAEVESRRARLGLDEGQVAIGCPLCGVDEWPTEDLAQNQQQ